MNYLYHAYGLNIQSPLECPQLLPGSGTTDIIVSYGKVPPSLTDVRREGACYQAAKNKLLLRVDGVAKYLVSDGNSIVIEPDPSAEEDLVRLFLLGPVLGALLHQRGLLVLHGNAIVVDGGAVLFLGESGAGKSTLAAAFHQRGYCLAADDICAVYVNKDKLLLYPSFPQLKLWHDACQKLGQDTDELSKVRNKLGKYYLPLESGFWREPLPLKRLYLLKYINRKEFKIEDMIGYEKFMTVGDQIYRLRLAKGMGYSQNHLRHCATVAKQVPLSRITRPVGWFLLEELVELIENDLDLN